VTDEPKDETPEVDPKDFVKAVLGISPEDAETVREKSPATRKRAERGQTGPTVEYGNENDPGP
jgi:hypothetical protein